MNFVLSVFPDPESPLTRIVWSLRSLCRFVNAASATPNTCGGISCILRPRYDLSVSWPYTLRSCHGLIPTRIGPVLV
eukprot:541265-Rhodomonas_salina.2